MKAKFSTIKKLIAEAIINEMNANNLPSKISVKDEDGKLTISFGKNGWGLTDEFLKIHEIVYPLSQENNIYLEECKVDTLDDTYNFVFSYDNEHFDD